MKKCSKCKIPKKLNEFNLDKSRKNGYSYNCKNCLNTPNKEHYKNNKEFFKKQSHIYYINNKKEHIKRNKIWVKETKKENLKYQREYYKVNNKKIKEYRRNRIISKEENLIRSLRIRFKEIIKKNRINKNNSVVKYLECNIIEYKQYIEKQFKPEMTWLNHGEIWEIDHITPISSFDLTKEENIYKAFSYKNVQPLFKTTEIAESYGYKNYIGNRDKGDKIL